MRHEIHIKHHSISCISSLLRMLKQIYLLFERNFPVSTWNVKYQTTATTLSTNEKFNKTCYRKRIAINNKIKKINFKQKSEKKRRKLSCPLKNIKK